MNGGGGEKEAGGLGVGRVCVLTQEDVTLRLTRRAEALAMRSPSWIWRPGERHGRGEGGGCGGGGEGDGGDYPWSCLALAAAASFLALSGGMLAQALRLATSSFAATALRRSTPTKCLHRHTGGRQAQMLLLLLATRLQRRGKGLLLRTRAL